MMLLDRDAMELRHSFDGAWRDLGARKSPCFDGLVARYGESHRAYHTLEHVRECLGWLEATRDLAEHPAEVALALWYHDAVYDPRRTDNETRSADLFRVDATEAGLPARPGERVAKLIERTASHRHEGVDGALVNDIDLAILGASPSRYARFERDVRLEYAHVDDVLFRAGRTRVLSGFLGRLSIYTTPFFEARLEAQARWNIARALEGIR